MRVRLSLLEAGRSWQLERAARRRGRWRAIGFPATVGVVEHPHRGVLLFDTGYADRYFAATRPLPERLYRTLVPVTLGPGETAVHQLRAHGIAARDVRAVLLSHLHADHLSGLCDFPHAEVLVSRETALPAPGRPRGAARWRAAAHGVLPALLPGDLAGRLRYVEDRPGIPTGIPGAAAGYDLLGDGSAVAVPLPGHAPGHLGLWLPRTQGPPVLLAGDACWLQEAFLRDEHPPAPVLAMIGDRDGYRDTVAVLAGLARSRPEVRIVPSHCTASVAATRAALGS